MRTELGGLQGVVDPLIALLTHVELGAERSVVDLALGTLINQRALGTRERLGLGIAFDEVLANFGAYEFEDEAHMPHDGIVAQYGVLLLQQIPDAEKHQQQRRNQPPKPLACRGQRVERNAQHERGNEEGAIAQGQTIEEAMHCRYSHGRVC